MLSSCIRQPPVHFPHPQKMFNFLFMFHFFSVPSYAHKASIGAFCNTLDKMLFKRQTDWFVVRRRVLGVSSRSNLIAYGTMVVIVRANMIQRFSYADPNYSVLRSFSNGLNF